MRKLVCIAAMVLASGLAYGQNVTEKDFAAVCPLDLPGVSAKATPTADGVDVVFATTVKNAIPDLQGRIGLLSDLLNRAVAEPQARTPRAAVKFSSRGEATPDGGRLLLTPADKADLEKLQANVAGKIGTMNAEKTCYLLANVN